MQQQKNWTENDANFDEKVFEQIIIISRYWAHARG